MIYTPEEFAARLDTALVMHDATRDRSMQTNLGFSDLRCHERARRKLAGVPPSDEPSRWAAQVGTALHGLWAEALDPADGMPKVFPGMLVERELSVTLPSGLVVTGHPDGINPDEPSCNDGKSVNGPGALALRRRHGPEDDQIAQVTLGFEAARQAGIITHDQGIVRIFWRDRSGKSDETVVWQAPFDRAWLDYADRFYEDVLYAHSQDEEAMKDPHWSWCEQWCEHFTGCRGGRGAFGGDVDDDVLAQAARDAYEAKQLADYYADEYEAAWDVLGDLWHGVTPGDKIPTFNVGGIRARRSWVNSGDGYWRRDLRPIEKESA